MSALLSIVYHSNLPRLRETLDSLRLDLANLHVVVLDVSEANDTRELSGDYAITTHWNPRNGGFAWGHHQNFDAFGDRASVFICSNPDITFPPNSLNVLIEHVKNKDSAVYYPVQLSTAKTLALYSAHPQLSVGEALSRWLGVRRRKYSTPVRDFVSEAHHHKTTVPFPHGLSGSGALIAMSTDLWRKSGGLDQDFFLFDEDVEFGHRLSVMGIPSYLCGDAPVIHAGGFRTLGPTASASTENIVSEQIYWEKVTNLPIAGLIAMQTIGVAGRIAMALIRGDTRKRKAWTEVFRYRISHIKTADSAPKGTDGVRLAAGS